jgi:hypothetical protein
MEFVQTDIICQEIMLGFERSVMRMRRGSWVVASSLQLTTSSNCLVGIAECIKLKIISLHVIYGTMSMPDFINFRPATL